MGDFDMQDYFTWKPDFSDEEPFYWLALQNSFGKMLKLAYILNKKEKVSKLMVELKKNNLSGGKKKRV